VILPEEVWFEAWVVGRLCAGCKKEENVSAEMKEFLETVILF